MNASAFDECSGWLSCVFVEGMPFMMWRGQVNGHNNRVFPKIDHSPRSDRIVLVEYWISCRIKVEDLTEI